MKKKWNALLLCVCMATSGVQIDNAYAMEEQEVQKNDMATEDFETNVSKLAFVLDKENEYSWSCVTKNMRTCTVKQVENQMDEEGNLEAVFQVESVCEGIEYLDFSYTNEQGNVKKNLTYKVEVASNGTMEWTKMAYYSDDMKQSVGNLGHEEDGAFFAFPEESNGAGNIEIADTEIVDHSYFDYFYGDYNNETEKEWFQGNKSDSTQYTLLNGKKEGTTTLTVTYCGESKGVSGNIKLSYQLVVDKNLHITVIPAEYVEPEKDPSEGIITRKNGGTTGYIWSYKVADSKIADITDKDYIAYNAYTVGGGGTEYYTVKGVSSGTTYIRFICARNEESGFNSVDVQDSAWYRVDVDEQKHVTITEISYEELPEDVDLPKVTSEPKTTPEVSSTPIVATAPPEIEDETRVSKLSFDKETDSECSWVCTTKDLKYCTVEKLEAKPSDSTITEEIFKVMSVCEGTELLNFSYIDKQGVVKKNFTYKLVVDSEGKMTFTRMAFYSQEVKNSVEDWKNEDESIFICPMGIRASENIEIADGEIVECSNTSFFQKQYYGADWGMFQPGMEYVRLEPQKKGSTILTVTYCENGESEIKMSKITYKLVVDKELHLTIIPMEYAGPGEDLTEGIITKDGNPSASYCWSYKVADKKIADITDYLCIYKRQDYRDYYWFAGPATEYYTVKGLSQGTTYICFTYGDHYEREVFEYVWYRIDVDEQKHISITEIPYEEVPENVELPKITSSPAVTASSEPENSISPEVSEKPEKTSEGNSTPVMQTEPPKTTVIPEKTPDVTVNPTATPELSTTTAPATVDNKNVPAEVASDGGITATKAPEVTKQEMKKVGTVKIISSIRKSVKKAVVKWKKLTGVKGYQVVIATDKKFSKNVKKKNVSETKVILSSLRKGKKYYVKVRAYRVDKKGKKVYGTYSDVKVVKKK